MMTLCSRVTESQHHVIATSGPSTGLFQEQFSSLVYIMLIIVKECIDKKKREREDELFICVVLVGHVDWCDAGRP